MTKEYSQTKRFRLVAEAIETPVDILVDLKISQNGQSKMAAKNS